MRVAHILYPVLALALSISSVVAVPSGNSMAEFAKRDPKPEAAPSPSEPYMSNARRLAEGLPLNPPSKRASGQLARRSGIATCTSSFGDTCSSNTECCSDLVCVIGLCL